jgi:hypothetical protein
MAESAFKRAIRNVTTPTTNPYAWRCAECGREVEWGELFCDDECTAKLDAALAATDEEDRHA